MVVDNVRPLKADQASNMTQMNLIRQHASVEYRDRIPEATQANIADTMKAITNYRPAFNEFIDGLINRIGRHDIHYKSWTNPMAVFKTGLLEWGDTIEETQIGLIAGKVYDPDLEYLEKDIFGTYRPVVESNFHTVNRQQYYPITVNEALLKRAFLETGGLTKFVSALLAAPLKSDQLDEFKVMCNLFKERERNGGYFHVNIPDVASFDSDGSDARMALRKIRATAENMSFITTHYNAAGFPTHTTADELVLFCTPEFKAAIDVEALAAAFNMDKMNIEHRIITIPQAEFGIPGCQAILVDEAFFVVADSLLENTSSQNPVGLSQNYFLHHWQVVSASRFANAVMFWTGPSDVIPEAVVKAPKTISAIDVWEGDPLVKITGTTVERGGMYLLDANVTTDAPDGPNVIAWNVVGNTSLHTHVSETGVLTVGGTEAGAFKVVAEAVGYDENNLRADAPRAELTLTATGALTPVWPAGGEAQYVLVGGYGRLNLVEGTNAYEFESSVTEWTPELVNAVNVFASAGGVNVQKSFTGSVLTLAIDSAYGKPARTITVTLVPLPA